MQPEKAVSLSKKCLWKSLALNLQVDMPNLSGNNQFNVTSHTHVMYFKRARVHFVMTVSRKSIFCEEKAGQPRQVQ